MSDSLPEQLDEEDEFILRFSRSQCTLYAFILGLTHDASDADDVLQEVNLALCRKRHTYDSKYEFVPRTKPRRCSRSDVGSQQIPWQL